jgi:tRNA (guanine-N7-)-methyltransferase
MSAKREHALTQYLPQLEISQLERPIDLRRVLARDEIVIDLGSGMGDHTTQLAADNPHLGVLAIDVHTVGLCELSEFVAINKLDNVRTHHGDGLDVLNGWLLPESISEVHVLFPDPWPKARHHKRRLLQPNVVEKIIQVLRPGGVLRFVTDDANYYEHAMEILQANQSLIQDSSAWDIPMTTYHRRALRLGNEINSISFRKLASS